MRFVSLSDVFQSYGQRPILERVNVELADLLVFATQFIVGVRSAADKTAYLRLAGVPFERPGTCGPTALKSVGVELKTEWQVGTASPSFGSRELSYLPYPGSRALIYVSIDEKVATDIKEFLAAKKHEFARQVDLPRSIAAVRPQRCSLDELA